MTRNEADKSPKKTPTNVRSKVISSEKVFGRLQRPGVNPMDMEKEREQVKTARLRHYEETFKEG